MPEWKAVRERLRRQGGPSLSSDIWRRIEASRAGGAAVELPAEHHRMLPRVVLYAALLVASILALIPPATNAPTPVPTNSVIAWGWPFLPEAVLAQAANAPHLPAIGAPDGSRLKEGQWVYTWTPTKQSIARDFPEMADTLTIRRGTFRDEAVWLVTRRIRRVTGQGTGRFDSLYLRITDLRPLRHALLVPKLDRLRVGASMDFQRDSLRWQFALPGTGRPGRDTVLTAHLPSGYTTVWIGFPLLLNGLEFGAHWEGAVPMLVPSIDWSSHDSPVHIHWFDLRVTGRERITVPAGRFDCWRISETLPGNKDRKMIGVLWVDTRSGVVVKESPSAIAYPPGGRVLAAILP
jgi:hypothetical protein